MSASLRRQITISKEYLLVSYHANRIFADDLPQEHAMTSRLIYCHPFLSYFEPPSEI